MRSPIPTSTAVRGHMDSPSLPIFPQQIPIAKESGLNRISVAAQRCPALPSWGSRLPSAAQHLPGMGRRYSKQVLHLPVGAAVQWAWHQGC